MYRKTTLSNGIRIVTEQLPHAKSVSLGIWVKTGSRDEKVEENGISHFIEHMLFKGTKKRTALEIAKEIDSVGGVLNASTSREYTNFYAKVLDKDFDLALDLLSDIFLHSLFSLEEIERERGVIYQEIKMVEDTPDELIQDLFSQNYFSGHPLGNPILGSYATISPLTQAELTGFFRSDYLLPSRIIVAVAGKLDHDTIVEKIEATLGTIDPCEEQRVIDTPHPQAATNVFTKSLGQVHLCMGTKGVFQTDPFRFTGYLLNTVLGGSMSSRLFQEVREKHGLAYAVFSYLSAYSDTGVLSIYAGTTSDNLRQLIDLVMKELRNLKEFSLEEKELVKAKDQMKGNILLSCESTDNRMSRLASGELYFGRYVPVEEVICGIEQVTVENVQQLAQELFQKDLLSMALLGDVREGDIPSELLEL